jgi:hypothetical protein
VTLFKLYSSTDTPLCLINLAELILGEPKEVIVQSTCRIVPNRFGEGLSCRFISSLPVELAALRELLIGLLAIVDGWPTGGRFSLHNSRRRDSNGRLSWRVMA